VNDRVNYTVCGVVAINRDTYVHFWRYAILKAVFDPRYRAIFAREPFRRTWRVRLRDWVRGWA
jgi:hypothetical protein